MPGVGLTGVLAVGPGIPTGGPLGETGGAVDTGVSGTLVGIGGTGMSPVPTGVVGDGAGAGAGVGVGTGAGVGSGAGVGAGIGAGVGVGIGAGAGAGIGVVGPVVGSGKFGIFPSVPVCPASSALAGAHWSGGILETMPGVSVLPVLKAGISRGFTCGPAGVFVRPTCGANMFGAPGLELATGVAAARGT